MPSLISLLAAILLLPCLSQAQTKKVIVVLGSSTAAGSGASADGKGWVDRVNTYYNNLGLLKENIHNLALSGATTYNAMPTGYVPPPGRPAVDTLRNVTKALSFNPDIVIVSYPGNDLVLGFSMDEYLSNLQTISNTVTAAGKICWITTTQPRDALPAAGRQQLKDGRDRIMAQFPVYGLDFFTPVVDLSSNNYLGINPLYAAPNDGIHLNDSGHAVLAGVVENANVIGGAPLGITLLSFTVTRKGQAAVLNWATTASPVPDYFAVQRSADQSSFIELVRIAGKAGSSGNQTNYSWTDKRPLSGKSFYRLKIAKDGNESYSPIASFSLSPHQLSIATLYMSGGPGLQAEISTPDDQQLALTVTNNMGVVVRRQTIRVMAPSQQIPVSMTGLAAGIYFLKVTTADGQQVTRAFLSF